MTKRKVWIARDGECNGWVPTKDYKLFYFKPEQRADVQKTWFRYRMNGVPLLQMLVDDFERLFPALKLRPNGLRKAKLTQLENGIKLEFVK